MEICPFLHHFVPVFVDFSRVSLYHYEANYKARRAGKRELVFA